MIVNRLIVATTLLSAMTCGSAHAAQWNAPAAAAMQPCLVEVLHSEMIPLGPLFHHTIKTTLLCHRARPPAL